MLSFGNLFKNLNKLQKNKLKPAHDNYMSYLKKIFNEKNEKIPQDIINLYAYTSGGFVNTPNNDTYTILDPIDILNDNKNFGFSFLKNGLVPIVAIGENSYICFSKTTKKYLIYNINDKSTSSIQNSLNNYFK